MKFIQLLAVILGVSTVTSVCHAQFRNTKWGDGHEAVFHAEQLTESDIHYDDITETVTTLRSLDVAKRKVRAGYYFLDGKLCEGSYRMRMDDLTLNDRLNEGLEEYTHFFSLLEMKYGTVDTVETSDALRALLETAEKLDDLDEVEGDFKRLLIDEFHVSPRNYRGWGYVICDVMTSTWKLGGTTINLRLTLGRHDKPKSIEAIEQASVSIYINYSDTENWQRGVEWRREQAEAEQKRKTEQEKKDLLKGL